MKRPRTTQGCRTDDGGGGGDDDKATTIYTSHRDKVFVALLLKTNVTLLPVFQFCVTHFKRLPCAKSHTAFLAVHFSTFLHSFPSLALVSHCPHATGVLRFSLQLSMCLWNPT